MGDDHFRQRIDELADPLFAKQFIIFSFRPLVPIDWQ